MNIVSYKFIQNYNLVCFIYAFSDKALITCNTCKQHDLYMKNSIFMQKFRILKLLHTKFERYNLLVENEISITFYAILFLSLLERNNVKELDK